MEVLFEDSSIAVCIKPAGVLSEESETRENMPALLRERCGGEIYPVHRLDKETQGLTVYAKTRESAAALSLCVQRGEFHKEYLAVCRGTWEQQQGELTDYLLHDARKNKSFVVNKGKAGAKSAKLAYEILGESAGMSLAKIRLFTGRTHQIRVQFSARNHPLYGDKKYGGAGSTLALFACSLAFCHPVTGENLHFTAFPQKDAFPWSGFSF